MNDHKYSYGLIRTMALSSAVCLMLLLIRMQWSGSIYFVFLSWNLFLAWIPFLFSILLARAKIENRSGYLMLLLFCGWLIFFPNSPYIITDLFHLHQKRGIPLWFDLVLIITFAWNGLLLGFISLFGIQNFLKDYLQKRTIAIFTTFIMILCSFGIYLGRFPRWNSWDILSNPLTLASDILHMLLHPANNTRMIGVTFFFSLFLISAYRTLLALAGNFSTQNHEQKIQH